LPKKAPSINFETALEELNELVSRMEQGDLTLEQSLSEFEKGITLIKQCQQLLTDAEQRVQILTQQNDSIIIEDFHDEQE
jgi:exodeoxyribonuclease VII small subunit